MEIKECIIENAQFSYLLRVDGRIIAFQSSDSADYFEKHYRELGYKVIFKKIYRNYWYYNK